MKDFFISKYMYISIVFLPFLAAILSGLLGRALGVKGVYFINITCLLITTLLSFIAFYEVVICNSPVTIELFSWIKSEQLNITWSFYFDELTVSMLIPVLIVSMLVHLYSLGYMGEDPHQQRFFSFISLFTGLMLILVTGNNFLVMFVGWEGVGICSYLLVHFWFTRIAAVKSALNAMFTNRIGDFFLTLGFFALFFTFGTLDYATIFSVAPYININVITFISILLLLGAAAKSAQLGLHIWLPMAMEGPTPVSALIHAATMVTAGVYLLIRCSPLIEQSELALAIIMVIGAFTSFLGASIGLFQNDIKKVIAYSTLSQLGMMVIAVGLSQFNVALMHLVLHAMYKAGLFLAAGSVLHSMGDQQDFRRYGGLVKLLPLTYTVILIASLSLAALPWLSGYYSKDLIIELTYGSYSSLGFLVYVLAVVAACFTMLYSVKLIYYTFITYAHAPRINYEKTHESSWNMSVPLLILGILSVYLGNITKDFFTGLGSQGFGNSIFIHPNHIVLIDTEFGVPIFIKLLPLILSIVLAMTALYFFEKKPSYLLTFNEFQFGQNIYRFLNQRYWFELIYNKCIVKSVLHVGYVTNTILDRGVLELLGPRGIVAGLYKVSNYFASFDSGSIARYGFVMFSGLLFLLLIWIVFSGPNFDYLHSYV
jgi:NADH-ubiquinone oxidoreductase chain 5